MYKILISLISVILIFSVAFVMYNHIAMNATKNDIDKILENQKLHSYEHSVLIDRQKQIEVKIDLMNQKMDNILKILINENQDFKRR